MNAQKDHYSRTDVGTMEGLLNQDINGAKGKLFARQALVNRDVV